MASPLVSRLNRGRWVVLLATLAGVALTARLGVWQLDRASQKIAMQVSLQQRSAEPLLAELPADQADIAPLTNRRVRLRGEWLAKHTVFLDNRPMDGREGFYVVTPLKLAGSGRLIAVQRGWSPRAFDDRTKLQPVATPGGEVTVNGRIAPPPGRLYDFGGPASGTIRQNLDLAGYAAETGRTMARWSVVQEDALEDGLLRHWPRPALDVQKNYGYAFQWFALCGLIAILYVWFQLIRPRIRTAA